MLSWVYKQRKKMKFKFDNLIVKRVRSEIVVIRTLKWKLNSNLKGNKWVLKISNLILIQKNFPRDILNLSWVCE